MNIKQDITAALQDLHAHVTQKKDAAAQAAGPEDAASHVSVTVLAEIASVIEKLIELLTGSSSPAPAPAAAEEKPAAPPAAP